MSAPRNPAAEPPEIQRIRKCKALADELLTLRGHGLAGSPAYQVRWEALFRLMDTRERASVLSKALGSCTCIHDGMGEVAFFRALAEVVGLPAELIRESFVDFHQAAAAAALH